MRLIFIRHGEPDYNCDGLTEKGRRDARILADRIKEWKVDRVFVSPLGRAKETAEPSLHALNMSAEEIPWLREFSHPIINPTHGEKSVNWDFIPSDWSDNPVMYSVSDWLDAEPAAQNHMLKKQYNDAVSGMDEILAEYGLVRTGNYYINEKNPKNRRVTSTVIDMNRHFANELPPEDAGEMLLFFCHFGVTCLILSHLLNIPFNTLTHGTVIPTCGITIVNSEERWDNQLSFRMQTLGDVSHLLAAGEGISSAGSFTPLFQK